MTSKYPVTIIIPTYCASHESVVWFEECIQSALKTGAEVVVWDDGSPLKNKVLDVLRTYDKVVYGGTDENHGPSYARNRAADLAKTRLILPLDCDDYIAANGVEALYAVWLEQPGTPVFPDLIRVFHDGENVHRLVDWSCEAQFNILGIASVNVLHTKKQWQDIGGWDESFTRSDLFEDSEYNARLLMTYCGRNVHQPVIYYRQHDESRTKQKRAAAGKLATVMLKRIGGYEMACCGKNKKTISAAAAATLVSQGVTLEMAKATMDEQGADGTVLVQYVGGKGKGSHQYRGIVSGQSHKVLYGQVLYVDPRDARDENQPGTSLFVRVHTKQQPKAKNAPAPKFEQIEVQSAPVVEASEEPEQIERQPRTSTKQRTPKKK